MSSPDPFTERDFLRLFLRHAAALQVFARVLLPNWVSVDEVLQEASVVMWKKLDQLDSEEGFLPWAKMIVRFEALRLRHDHARDRHVFSDELLDLLANESDYLMLRIGMPNDTKSQDKRRDSFHGYFVDKLQLVIARRSEIPVP